MHAFKISNYSSIQENRPKMLINPLSRCSESIPPSKVNGLANVMSLLIQYLHFLFHRKKCQYRKKTTLIKRFHGVFKKWARTATGVPLRNKVPLRCVTFLTATVIVASHHIVTVQWKERTNGPRKERSSGISHSTWRLSKRKLCLNKIFFFPAQPQEDK